MKKDFINISRNISGCVERVLSKARFLRRGFTLIELLAVISIVGTLSSVTLGNLNEARLMAQDTQAIAEARNLINAFERYSLDQDDLDYPGTGTEWNWVGTPEACYGGLPENITSSVVPEYLAEAPSNCFILWDTWSPTDYYFLFWLNNESKITEWRDTFAPCVPTAPDHPMNPSHGWNDGDITNGEWVCYGAPNISFGI